VEPRKEEEEEDDDDDDDDEMDGAFMGQTRRSYMTLVGKPERDHLGYQA
jgi:hypothetical protein